ncbi:hypothetical protein GUJ93_ZPchr0002g25850 [Zizania palustris]|uniref:Uncharacterized protein n=1 Tax=Zizania palustris TaxID=103762 RepID=A0A8J5VCB9_ZIZPA|nr:hypothetical protein GUJ93_ZPchr0002g25850 [Zizania palustris]
MVLRRLSLVPAFSSEQSLPASTDPYLSPCVRRSQGPSSPRVMPPPNPPRAQRLLGQSYLDTTHVRQGKESWCGGRWRQGGEVDEHGGRRQRRGEKGHDFSAATTVAR